VRLNPQQKLLGLSTRNIYPWKRALPLTDSALIPHHHLNI